jgi:hypothetical protein
VSRPRDPLRAEISRRIRREQRFEEISKNSGIAYSGLVPGPRGKVVQQDPDKRQLMAMIVICAQLSRPLPPWAAQVILDAEARWRNGTLKSWDDAGKPFPGKRRKGAITRSRKREVLTEIRRLQDQEGLPIGPTLFEIAGENTGVGGKTTVSNLYYGRHSRKR